jgi:phthalate 4,5-cis-dihydrodiol dehydrogenase
MTGHKLRLGVAGLGRGFVMMLPTLESHPRTQIVAAADPRAEARAQFEQDFGGATYASVGELCADPTVDAVYVATPHQFHAEHVVVAATHRKHILVEKPMAVTLSECTTMVDAARAAGVQLVVGHSHSFDAPYERARELIATGAYGRPQMITALNYTDFLYRPRRAEELDTARGGGAVFSQAAHQVDVVRLLAGGHVRTVRALTGAWDAARPTEGAYSALLTFADGAFATLIYSGYAHFDSDEFCGWIGETGQRKDPARYGVARALTGRALSREDEAVLKLRRGYGSVKEPAVAPSGHNHFGLVIVSCEHADLRPLPNGVAVYADDGERFEAVTPPTVPRAGVLDELCDAIAGVRPAIHTGRWGQATLEVCLAILAAARDQKEITLTHQVGVEAP